MLGPPASPSGASSIPHRRGGAVHAQDGPSLARPVAGDPAGGGLDVKRATRYGRA